MSNKFQKAIEKRNLQLESENIENENKNIEEIKEYEEIKQDNKTNIDINNLFVKNTKKSKNKTFYLEEKVILAIERESKKQKVSDSKFLNKLLEHIFEL